VSGAYLGHLICSRCGAHIDETTAFSPCRACLEDGVLANPLPAYDPDGVSSGKVRDEEPGIFRFRHWLPLDDELAVVSKGEGDTPLLLCDRLGSMLGIDNLYIKNESVNPTWSYKDRLAAVALSKARELEAAAVVVSSTGNHGAAASAYAAAAQIPCVALTIESVPQTMKVLMQAYGALVVAYETGPQRWEVMTAAVAQRGWMPLSGFNDPPFGSNPFGVDGYKTIAFEILEDLGRAPDFVVVPTAYGDGIIGILRGFEDLVVMGRISQLPRMIAAEVSGTYEAAIRDNLETPPRVNVAPSVAFSIATPIGTFQALHAIRSSNGHAVAVADNSEIMETQALVARNEGLYLEASSALGVAAASELRKRGIAQNEDTIVVIGTSTGLKDVDATARTLPPVPVLKPDLASLEAIL